MAQEKLKQLTPTRAVTTLREEETGKVKVVYGVHALEASLAGRTVQSVREALVQPLNISPQAVTLVDGQEVEGTHVLSPGELLEFVRYAGEKGVGNCVAPLSDVGSIVLDCEQSVLGGDEAPRGQPGRA